MTDDENGKHKIKTSAATDKRWGTESRLGMRASLRKVNGTTEYGC